MKIFNTTAICVPSKHYMVDISEKVNEIRLLVDAGKYFTINRARQYGKTTTLTALKKTLQGEYIVLSLDFQGADSDAFESGAVFSQTISRLILDQYEFEQICIPENTLQALRELNACDPKAIKMDELFRILKRWIKNEEKAIVLIIDEIDRAANSQVFLDFLAQLRDGYIGRDSSGNPAFQSVILAGVTDIKHLKSRIRITAKENSPWNIAADFLIDMSLSESGIQGMLVEYEADHHTGMDTGFLAKKIREYTNGYPYLVSRICQLIDERLVPETFGSLSVAWTDEGVETAVRSILVEKNTLFDSLMGKLRDYDKLRIQLGRILLRGETIEYLPDNKEQEQLMMYGFIVNDPTTNTVRVANRIFEMRLYKYYIGESRFSEELRGDALDNKPAFIKNGELDIPLIMERFIETQRYIRNLKDEDAEKRFIEEEGREKFLTYISPIINGIGTYSVEERTRDRRRMDVVIHYLGKRYIIELKIWYGERYNKKGEQQIIDYLDSYGLNTGYLLSFSFNKTKEPGVEKISIEGKTVYEGIV